MKTLVNLILLALAAPHAWSQATHGEHTGHPTPAAATSAAAPAAGDATAAEVRRIDKAAKKITLKHEQIKNLDMPPMTMVFQVQDASLLDSVQPGDRVLFTAERINGAYVALTLRPAAGR